MLDVSWLAEVDWQHWIDLSTSLDVTHANKSIGSDSIDPIGLCVCVCVNQSSLTPIDFRFLKRTLKGIHLLSHSPQGIQIQFYLYMIAYMLLISFKQECESITQSSNVDDVTDETPSLEKQQGGSGRIYVCGLVTLLGEKLKKTLAIRCALANCAPE